MRSQCQDLARDDVVFQLIVAVAIGMLEYYYGPLSWVAILASIGGFGGTIMMSAALMGLMFLSSGTGHDEAVDARDYESRGDITR